MIYPERRVTWSLSPVSLEFLLLERLMKYKEDQGVGGRVLGAGYVGEVLSRVAYLYRQYKSVCTLHVIYAGHLAAFCVY